MNLRLLGTALLTVPFLFGVAPRGSAGTCIKTNGPCVSVSTLSVTGPVIICPSGDDVIEVESYAECSGNGAGPVVFYRCSSRNNRFVYSSGGYLHGLYPTPGNDWGDALADCDDLAYSVAVQFP